MFSALRFVNMDKLLEIFNDLKNKARCYPRNLMDVCLYEKKIFSQNYETFKVMKKRLLDLLCLPYISCKKLCVSRDVSKLEKLRKTVDESFWKDLMVYVTETQYRYWIHL